MTLTYWICMHRTDSNCYSIRAKTKREAARLRDEDGAEKYDPPKKVTVEYSGAFDLMFQCSEESRHYWEYV